MKKSLLFSVCIFMFLISKEQVTQINANKNLLPIIALNSTNALFESSLDSSIWVSNGTVAGTIQITDTIKYIGFGQLLNGKLIFKGYSPKCGKEIFITDGTKSGTKLIKDINAGIAGSQPDGTTMAVLSNYVYFAAFTTTSGSELWKTDGTAANTVLVKDIVAGPTSGIDTSHFSIESTASAILFNGTTAANGNELWSSGGTSATTNLLKDINSGTVSSNPRGFYPFNSGYLFTVTSVAGTTIEIWKTNGTAAGTVLIKNNIQPPAYLPASFSFNVFHIFKNRAYFLINDGIHTGDAMWSTDAVDATTAHTSFLKDLGTLTGTSSILLSNAINLSDKFIFPYSDGVSIFSLWQSDGTATGTKVFKSFPVNSNGDIPFIFSSIGFDAGTNTISYPLYNGKFYFSGSDANGNELWMSDGTTTQLIKDIYPGNKDGITSNASWLFTTAGLFFAADNGTLGDELWKTDGTTTTVVKDIFTGVHNANPALYFVNNGKIFFSATDGNPADTTLRDLFVVDGIFTALPVKLLDFTVTPKGSDAIIEWSTAQEINAKDFTVQSGFDAEHWNNLGTVAAKGNSALVNKYSFTDFEIMNSGREKIYYRLVTTDEDGKNSYSNIISLKIKNEDSWQVRLYSNPVHENLGVELSGVKDQVNLSIHELTGKRIYNSQISQNGLISIPFNNASPGVYILVIKSGDKSESIKFIKE